MRRYIILLGLVFVVACKNGGEGYVFLDKNGDNIRQESEKGISNVLYKVTKDGLDHTSGVTDEFGHFNFDITEKGYYCTEVKSTNYVNAAIVNIIKPATTGTAPESAPAQNPNQKPTATKAFAEKGVLQENAPCTSNAECDTGLSCQASICKKIGNGSVDEGGACDSSSVCKSGLTCSSGKCTTIGAGSSCEHDSECSTGLKCISGICTKTGTSKPDSPDETRSLKTCNNASGWGLVESDVPVAMGFEATLDQLPTPPEVEAEIGVPFTAELFYPCSCKPLNLVLPANMAVSSDEAAIKSVGGVLDVSALIPQANMVKLPNYDITSDKICKIKTNLVVTDTSAAESIDLAPKAICPNNNTISMKGQVIKWTKPKVAIEQHTESFTGTALDKTITLVTKVNKYRSTKTGDEALGKLTVSVPSGSTDIKITAPEGMSCSTLFLDVKCNIPPDSDDKEIKIKFTMPSCEDALKMSPATTFIIKSKFESADGRDIKEEIVPVVAMPSEC
ncbi:MAG: hypothetical protein COV46_05685 [Deltaproteobacteria bacterium CG11_big_fil_rev_8_21_14_0_20_49_13]|nr:MAG: hypothetical protein COV46_05685 [Deltaproteobacteria bacterium CG11_big_fil_rev_8_21_14_0_20_49_13]